MIEIYDLIVVGAGAGGLTAAITARGFGKSVALVEKEKPGGECTWSGCIPSKGLINIAKEINIAKKYSEIEVDSEKVLIDVRKVIDKVYQSETPEVLREKGIHYFEGEAKFLDENTLSTGKKLLKGKKIIISTGSQPFIPPIKGLDSVDYLTNETLFTLEKFPKSMIILGGGAIGVEMAQALNRLGVKIDLIEMADEILIKEDREFVEILRKRLEDEGINIHTKAKAKEVLKNGEKIEVIVEKNEINEKIGGDSILIAVGRKANIENLDLDAGNMKANKRGIEVDKHLQTSNPKVYAIGDVVGPYQFSHMANYQGIIATQNALTPLKKSIDYTHITWCTFTEPELASAGITEKEAKEKYGEIEVYRYNAENLDRAKVKTNDICEVKIICDKHQKILGCQILADRAGEMISEIQSIKANNISLDKLSKAIHPYPSYGEIFYKAGKEAYVRKLMNNPIIHFLGEMNK